MTIGKLGPLTLTMLTICTILSGCGRQSRERILSFGKPPDMTLVGNLPTWRGLTVGEATRDEILAAIGNPERTWSSGNVEALRFLPSGYKREKGDTDTYYRLVLQNGVLQVILIQVWGYDYRDLLADVGTPAQIIRYQTQDAVAVFPSQGVTAVVGGTGPDDYVSFLQFYAPTSAEDYMQTWGRFHPEELPWPRSLPDRIDLIGFVPGKTTKDEVERVLGSSDFEWTNRAKSSDIVFYHIPSRISTRVDRFEFHKGILTWMNVEVAEKGYSISDAVRTLGQVDVVINSVSPVQYYVWAERGIVLVASMEEELAPIETGSSLKFPHTRPSGADKVVAHVQFKPVSLKAFVKQRLYDRITEEVAGRY